MATEYQALSSSYSDLAEELEEVSDDEEDQEVFTAKKCKKWNENDQKNYPLNHWKDLGTRVDKSTHYDHMCQVIAGDWCKWCDDRAWQHHCHYLVSREYWDSLPIQDFSQDPTPSPSSEIFWTSEEWQAEYDQSVEGWPELSDEPFDNPWQTEQEFSCLTPEESSANSSFLNPPTITDLELYEESCPEVNLLTTEAMENIKLGNNLNSEEQDQLKTLILQYSDIFACSSQDLKRANVAPFTIETGDISPINEQPRRTHPKNSHIIQEKIQELLDNGVIEKCASPWAAPVVVVHKEGKEPRLCIDYRRLNSITRKNSYPLIRIDDILENLGASKIFTTLDAKSGYHQIPVRLEDQDKTAFTTQHGTYKWTGMPFGLCNAPSAYQSIMDTLFQDILWNFVMNYIDDTVVHSRTFQEHLHHLREVFGRFRKVNLKLHIKKCFFGFDHVDLLGHHISAEGTWTKKDTIEKIQQFPTPTDVTKVRSFLGLSGWYRNFVQNYSIIAKPLNKLTKKTEEFLWTEDCEEAFQELKRKLIEPPILARPDFSKPFILHTDASTIGLGAILAQKDDEGRERVIYYASRGLNTAESKYSVTSLELMAVVWAVKKFYIYLQCSHVDIYTDHSALKGLLKTRSLKDYNKQVNRWVLFLQDIDYTIHYRAGKDHQHADALSRLGF